jgi:hypothetical protein
MCQTPGTYSPFFQVAAHARVSRSELLSVKNHKLSALPAPQSGLMLVVVRCAGLETFLPVPPVLLPLRSYLSTVKMFMQTIRLATNHSSVLWLAVGNPGRLVDYFALVQ